MEDFFQEDNDAIKRFSTVVFFIFIYYTLSYFFITKSGDCIKKPHVSKVLGLMLFHIIHILLVKYLHNQELFSYMWIAAILPVFLYLVCSKYMEMQKRKEDRKMKELYAKLQQQENGGENVEFMRNTTNAGGPPAAPMRGKQYVGLHQNNLKKDDLRYHQQQHNNPLPPQNPNYSMQQAAPQLAIQENMANTFQEQPPQYDQNFGQNQRQVNNNTFNGQTQPLDMKPLGGDAGSLNGFDTFGSTFAPF